MKLVLKKLLMGLFVVAAAALLAFDSRQHFSRDLIYLKRQHNSAQRNWNLFYGQNFVYFDSSFRYQRDLGQIKKLVKPGQIVFSDLATSYYVAGNLPAYVRNVHRHHGRKKDVRWRAMFDANVACNLDQEGSFSAFKEFVEAVRDKSAIKVQPKLNYVIVNKDLSNKNVRSECLSNRRETFERYIEKISSLKYQGEFLDLYKLDD